MRLRTIHLYGKLKEMCNGDESVVLAGDSIRMLVAGLSSRYGEGVKSYIKENNWHIYLNDSEKGDIGEVDVPQLFDNSITDVHMFPVVEGSGRTGKIIAGIILIVIGAILYYYGMPEFGQAFVSMGVGMILQGLFAPRPQGPREKPEERASFIFNGATNRSEQGQGVPLVYGRFRTGSVIVSAGIDTEQLTQYTSPIGTNPAPNDEFDIIVTP